jgi:hypothetical protein
LHELRADLIQRESKSARGALLICRRRPTEWKEWAAKWLYNGVFFDPAASQGLRAHPISLATHTNMALASRSTGNVKIK